MIIESKGSTSGLNKKLSNLFFFSQILYLEGCEAQSYEAHRQRPFKKENK